MQVQELGNRYQDIRKRLMGPPPVRPPVNDPKLKPPPVQPWSMRFNAGPIRGRYNGNPWRLHGALPPSIEAVIAVVCQHYGYTRHDILSDRRYKDLTLARHVAQYVAKSLMRVSAAHIGRRFGNRDHSTVIHAIRKIGKLIRTNPRIEQDVEFLLSRFARPV